MEQTRSQPHQHAVKVRFYELDPYGHMNHSVYVQLFETGRIELLDSVGLGLHDLEVQGYRFVVAQIATRFLASAVGGDHLVVETEVLDVRRASSRWGQRILRVAPNSPEAGIHGVVDDKSTGQRFQSSEILATQEVVAAVTGTNGRPTRSPKFMAERLAPYVVEATG